MKALSRIILTALIAATAAGCKAVNTLTDSKKASQGKPYELIVVCPQQEWTGEVGDTLRAVLTAPVPYLNQTEPLFDVLRVQERGFTGLVADHRNILKIRIDPSLPEVTTGVEYDVTARPQIVLTTAGPDDRSLVEYISKNRENLVHALEQAERDRAVEANSKFYNTGIDAAVRKTADGEQASVTVDVKPDKPAAKPAQTVARQPAAQGKPEAPKPADSVPTESADAEGSAKKGSLPFGISTRIDAAMQLLSNDPIAFARCMLGHTGWLGRHLLRSVRVSGLDIFWTVTADEASTTAELFGAEMALANNLLALVQQYIRVQSDRLWLEPDFTGERAGERIVSFRLTSCAAVLLWLVIRLLHRLWKDPQLQPAAKA